MFNNENNNCNDNRHNCQKDSNIRPCPRVIYAVGVTGPTGPTDSPK